MDIYIDNKNLFKEILETGINLFLGAGFSVLPYKGKSLPTCEELCNEIRQEFNLSDTFGNDLSVLSIFAPKDEYQEFLRKRFTVDGCNVLYEYINNINLKSIITTNIDNLPHIIIKKKNKYYLNSITYYGVSKSTQSSVDFIPLHGEVTNISYPLFFEKFDLSLVDNINRELFEEMEVRLLRYPTLFWGYGFYDQGVLKSIAKVLNRKRQDFWVQCLPEDKVSQAIFKKVGVNIICSDTKELLLWLRDALPLKTGRHESENGLSSDLKKIFYSINL